MDDTRRQSAGNSHLDWLAGIIDGEGSLLLAKRSGKNWVMYKPTITIANTHKPTIEKAAEILKNHGIGVWICTNRDKRGNYPAQYSLFVCGLKRMLPILDLLESRLFTKKRQAELLRQFTEHRLGIAKKVPYGETEKRIYEDLKRCNHGPKWTGSPETTRDALAFEAREDIVRVQ